MIKFAIKVYGNNTSMFENCTICKGKCNTIGLCSVIDSINYKKHR